MTMTSPTHVLGCVMIVIMLLLQSLVTRTFQSIWDEVKSSSSQTHYSPKGGL